MIHKDDIFYNGLEVHINSDPTLYFLLRESKFDSKLLMHQVDVRIGAFKVALAQYLDRKYPTKH